MTCGRLHAHGGRPGWRAHVVCVCSVWAASCPAWFGEFAGYCSASECAEAPYVKVPQ